jgi:S-adenosylmethionine decarboxylase
MPTLAVTICRKKVHLADSQGNAGSAYTVGPINRDNWLLYITGANPVALAPSGPERPLALPPPCSGAPDQTLEILMSHLTPAGAAPFFLPELPAGAAPESRSGHELGADISAQLGIDTLFPQSETILDSFGFEPCGYSANAVVGSGLNCSKGDGGYFTIHVTPEDGWSYASFECNVPLPLSPNDPSGRPDMPSLIRRVVDIFQPNRLTITLFVSTGEDSPAAAAAPATKVIGADLFDGAFTRKDRIVYEFEGYDLLFACFERRGWTPPRSPNANNKITLLP